MNKSFTPRQITAAKLATPHLMWVAKQENPLITYKDLCVATGLSGLIPRSAGRFLDVIHDICTQNKIPDLAALAVNSQTGRPGERYVLNDQWEDEVAKCRAFDWSSLGRLEGTVQISLYDIVPIEEKVTYRYQVDLDMVLEQTRSKKNQVCVRGEARTELKARHIDSKILQEIGPGGGNPRVRLTGSRIALEKYIREVYSPDDTHTAQMHIDSIERYVSVNAL